MVSHLILALLVRGLLLTHAYAKYHDIYDNEH